MSSVATRARFRALATRAARAFFDQNGLLEIEVPTMVASPGMEPQLRAFRVSAHEALEVDGRWLHTSPEYAIKASLSALGTDVYTFARSYRDEPPSRWHHPEFTMIEWYRLGVDHHALMSDCEGLILALAAEAGFRVASPFHRLEVGPTFERTVGVPVDSDAPTLAGALAERGVDADPSWGPGALFSVAYTQVLEPNLPRDRPTFLHAFPAEFAALAKLNQADPSVADRFELYVPGTDGPIELANAFNELVDAAEQRARFDAETEDRRRRGVEVYPMPEPMLDGIAHLDQAAGIALGFERLLVWLAEQGAGWETSVADWLVGEPHGAHR